MEKIEVLDNGCWHWTGTLFTAGYGRFYRVHGSQLAHRVAYELLVGPIPKGKTLDHICHNEDSTCNLNKKCPHRACVNPAHLEPVTIKRNILRGRGEAAKNAKQKTCQHGHPLRGKNLIRRNGKRVCRICAHERDLRLKRSPAGKRRSHAYSKSEKKRSYQKAYRESHRDEMAEYQHEYHQRHRQERMTRQKARREAMTAAEREKERIYQREWKRRNAERLKELQRKRMEDPAVREKRRAQWREYARRKRAAST